MGLIDGQECNPNEVDISESQFVILLENYFNHGYTFTLHRAYQKFRTSAAFISSSLALPMLSEIAP